MPITFSRRQKTLVVTGSLPDDQKPSSISRGCDDWSYAPPSWLERAKQDDLYDFMGKVPYSPLICVSRGKLLCLAAGPYALVLFLALETNVVGMPTSTYREIIKQDIPGPNPTRGDELRVFRIPSHLVDPCSGPSPNRTIRIVAAFVSEDWAWVINDFTSLIQMHLFVKSDGIWTNEMLSPSTEVTFLLLHICFTILILSICSFGTPFSAHFQEDRTGYWRPALRPIAWMSGGQTSWLTLVSVVAAGGKPLLFHGYSNFHKTIDSPRQTKRRSGWSSDMRPIIFEILKNKFGCFAGIGRYTANDLLHVMCIYPLTPAHEICNDDSKFLSFKNMLYTYINSFNCASYLDRTLSIPNTLNPLSFNEWGNSEYLSKWVYVYHRTKAIVPVQLYNKYLSLGLLDDHVIGEYINL